MRKLGFVVAILLSSSCYALVEEQDAPPVMHYALVPAVGAHFAVSELSGKNALSPGLGGSLGFRLLRDGYFFIPAVRLVSITGLDKSPATFWAAGAIAGGHVDFMNLDVFFGADWVTFLDYKLNAGALYKIGAIFNLGTPTVQLVVNGFYGNLTQSIVLTKTTTLNVNYGYGGAEIALQLPIDL